jgi:hydroxyethylthiazole kinase
MAARVARESGVPWVLDPVFADRSGMRRREAVRLLAEAPTLTRGNGAEISALADALSGQDGLIARTGVVDLVAHGPRVLTLEGGHPYLARVTAVGCALSAVLAAFLAVSRDDPFRGVVSGLAAFAAAGAIAGKRAAGPGSFAVHLLDALAGLTADEIAEHVMLPDEAGPR